MMTFDGHREKDKSQVDNIGYVKGHSDGKITNYSDNIFQCT